MQNAQKGKIRLKIEKNFEKFEKSKVTLKSRSYGDPEIEVTLPILIFRNLKNRIKTIYYYSYVTNVMFLSSNYVTIILQTQI